MVWDFPFDTPMYRTHSPQDSLKWIRREVGRIERGKRMSDSRVWACMKFGDLEVELCETEIQPGNLAPPHVQLGYVGQEKVLLTYKRARLLARFILEMVGDS